VPAAGGMGLLVALGANTPTSLVATLAGSGCNVETLGVIQAGTWYIYVNGAPATVNASFPASMTDRQGFFVRCR